MHGPTCNVWANLTPFLAPGAAPGAGVCRVGLYSLHLSVRCEPSLRLEELQAVAGDAERRLAGRPTGLLTQQGVLTFSTTMWPAYRYIQSTKDEPPS